MLNFVVGTPPHVTGPEDRDRVYLWPTGWDDWFQYSTLFNVIYVDVDGNRRGIGQTKIGEHGLQPAGKGTAPLPGYREPSLPPAFSELTHRHFSLGQDSDYYESLTAIGATFRDDYLQAMRDIAFDPDLVPAALAEDVTGVSLLRGVSLTSVTGQFARLARGGSLLTPYDFSVDLQPSGTPAILEFTVIPESWPPTNVHVLIGRNGVGKSTALHQLASLLTQDADPEWKTRTDSPWMQLANVVSVSFSAFDAFEPISVPRDRSRGISCHYIGLKKIGAPSSRDSGVTTKDPAALGRELSMSLKVCLQGSRRSRLLRALELLESDPIFSAAGLRDIVRGIPESAVPDVIPDLPDTFRRLSSGHKIVLLTITRLVETVEEKSLVLLDEPEAHLHPPLLSAFMRALSELLTNRNGLAIVATHSPVVLQEVPRSCVSILHRAGDVKTVSKPTMETFGENTGILTDEVFGLEVTSTGFHKMLAEAAERSGSYEDALSLFDGKVGSEGRAILRSMISGRGSHVAS